MNVDLRLIPKKDLEALMNDDELWNGKFLIGTLHRYYAHQSNPTASLDDIVLLLAFLNENLVGYMGVFIDKIYVNKKEDKIGWLSTWWLDPNTAGKGIGKQMLSKMYEAQGGKIGISQYTPSAKRVYDKSGFFRNLNSLVGCKMDVRLNLEYLLPSKYPSLNKVSGLLSVVDSVSNVFLNGRLSLAKKVYYKDLKSYSLEYYSYIPKKLEEFIAKHGKDSFCIRDKKFFEYLKKYHWIQEAPLMKLVQDRKKYYFSSYNSSFNIYLTSIKNSLGEIIGFFVLLRKDLELKVLQIYYDSEFVSEISKSIILHAIELNCRTIITYDLGVTNFFKQSSSMAKLRFKSKSRASIISKVFGDFDSSEYKFQYGDGDCSFA